MLTFVRVVNGMYQFHRKAGFAMRSYGTTRVFYSVFNKEPAEITIVSNKRAYTVVVSFRQTIITYTGTHSTNPQLAMKFTQSFNKRLATMMQRYKDTNEMLTMINERLCNPSNEDLPVKRKMSKSRLSSLYQQIMYY